MAEDNKETVNAVKLMIIGSLIAEYGARLMVDETRHELRFRVNNLIKAVKSIESHFLTHDNTTPEYRESFKKAFNRNETVLLADLSLTCWELNEDGLEEILKAIKQAIIIES